MAAPLLCTYEVLVHDTGGHCPSFPEFCSVLEGACTDKFLLRIPRTLYTLAYLRCYLYERPSRPFVGPGAPGYVPGDFGLPPFLHDLRTHREAVSSASLAAAAHEWAALPQVRHAQYRLNCFILSRLSELCCCSARQTPRLCLSCVTALLEQLLRELRAVAADAATDISEQYDVWPLLEPSLEAELMDVVDDDSQLELHYQLVAHAYATYTNIFVVPLLQELSLFLSRFLQADLPLQDSLWDSLLLALQRCLRPFSHLNPRNPNPLHTIAGNGHPLDDCASCSTHMRLVQRHCFPTIAQTMDTLSVDEGDHDARYRAASDLYASLVYKVRAVDNAAYCFRQPGYLRNEGVLRDIIEREWLLLDEDCFLLFRGGTKSAGPTPGSQAPLYSASYGASLFSGILADHSAVPYTALQPTSCGAFGGHGLLLSAAEEHDWGRFLFVPPVPLLAQLAGLGELYHPRTLVRIEGHDPSTPVAGVFRCTARRLPACLVARADPAEGGAAFLAAHRFPLEVDGLQLEVVPQPDNGAWPQCRLRCDAAWSQIRLLPSISWCQCLAACAGSIHAYLRDHVFDKDVQVSSSLSDQCAALLNSPSPALRFTVAQAILLILQTHDSSLINLLTNPGHQRLARLSPESRKPDVFDGIAPTSPQRVPGAGR